MLSESGAPGPWWKGLTPYMWWVLIVSALGWLFDVMDQRIFTISRIDQVVLTLVIADMVFKPGR